MKTFILAAAISAAACVASFTVAVPSALAGVGVSVDFGDVAIGYRDGYYDSGHHWHHWRHAHDYQAYGHAHPENYRDYGHGRDEHHH
jgi:hypothetical protein